MARTPRSPFTFAASSIFAPALPRSNGRARVSCASRNGVKRVEYPAAIKELIAQLKRMPGIGPRSAERIALWLVQSRDARPNEIADALRAVTEQVHPCSQCGFFSTVSLCEICADETRSHDALCVVEQPT